MVGVDAKSNPTHFCEIWLASTADLPQGAGLAHLEALLAPDEKQRYRRFMQDKHRLEFLLGRTLLRQMLSHIAPKTSASAWRFTEGPYGKPQLHAAHALALRFNVSHSHGVVACFACKPRAVSIENIGCDIEWTGRDTIGDAIAERYFAPSEAQSLIGLDETQRRQRFFQYWTLKEAYMKARGEGIALGLKNFAFSWPDGGPVIGDDIRLDTAASLAEEPSHWRFASLPLPTAPAHSKGLGYVPNARAEDFRLAWAMRYAESNPRTVEPTIRWMAAAIER